MGKILFEDKKQQLMYENLKESLIKKYKDKGSKVLVKPVYFTLENDSFGEFMVTLIFENKDVPYSSEDVSDLISIVSVPDFTDYGVEEDECSEVIVFES